MCPFCFINVTHFARHLQRKHLDEDQVKKILNMEKNSKDRKLAIQALRKKGSFVKTTETHKLKPMRKPNYSQDIDEKEYYPCPYCLGYYKRTYLWRHKKVCKAVINTDNKGRKIQHLTESQTFLVSTGLLGNFLNKSRLKSEVFGIMKPDNISLIAKKDSLICLFGESYLNKHKRKQMNVVASNKIREMARLKLALQSLSTEKDLIDYLKPEMYDHIITAAKIISGYDPELKTFTSASLAMHLGTSLKFLCDVAKKAIITKNFLFGEFEDKLRKKKLKDIADTREMISNHWCNDISSLANKVLNEGKWEKPKLLPLTEDIRCFNGHITQIASESYEKLKNNEDVSTNYRLLAESTLCLVLVFNRKRIGEIQFLDIQTYERSSLNINQEECFSSLSDLEKSMSKFFKRVVVLGKGSKPVPILFTKQMQTYIEMLLKIRKEHNIVPKTNKYIFALPESPNRWIPASVVLRKFSKECGAKSPELLTSTKLRKQIATILQLMNFQDDEMEQIARFMGHTEKTHREFYR